MDKEKLTSEKEELIRTVEAIDELLHSKAWQTLRELVFDKLEEKLNKQLLLEAKSTSPELAKIYVLQGNLSAIKRYDLATYAEMCKKKLEGIKQHLQ